MRRGAPVSLHPPRQRAGATALAVVVGLAVVLGCTREPQAEDLAGRAQRYMDLRQKASWDAIWTGLIDPTAREKIKRGAFMQRRQSSFDILEFEILSVDEQGDEGRVVARMDTVVPVLKPGGGILRVQKELDDSQNWVRRDGRWYIQLSG